MHGRHAVGGRRALGCQGHTMGTPVVHAHASAACTGGRRPSSARGDGGARQLVKKGSGNLQVSREAHRRRRWRGSPPWRRRAFWRRRRRRPSCGPSPPWPRTPRSPSRSAGSACRSAATAPVESTETSMRPPRLPRRRQQPRPALASVCGAVQRAMLAGAGRIYEAGIFHNMCGPHLGST